MHDLYCGLKSLKLMEFNATDNMIYGTAHEERKQSGEITCGDVESGIYETATVEHEYELTSGSVYAIPNELSYSTQGPSEEMVIMQA